MTHSDDRRRLLFAFVVSGLVRVAMMIPGFGELNDPDWYLPLARSLADGHGLSLDGTPTAYRPPLYPIVLAPLVATLGSVLPYGIAVLHLGLGLGTVGLTYLTARRWGYGPNRSLIAAMIVGLDPVGVVQARAVMTETLAAFLVVAGLAVATVPGLRGVLAAGLAVGVAGLCRPSLLPGAGLMAFALLVLEPAALRRRLVSCLLLVVGVVVPLVPWAVRNTLIYGEPVWTTTHGGYTLALANNPAYYADVLDGPPDAVWSGTNQAEWFARIGRETASMTHIEADRHLRNQAIALLRERPRDFLRASVARLGRFWGVAPSPRIYSSGLRMATAAWTIPLWGALVLGLLRPGLWKWPESTAPMVILGLTAVHALYWTDMRMRVPIIPAIALIAAGTGFRGISRVDSPSDR